MTANDDDTERKDLSAEPENFAKAEDGATAIEFALVAPILFLLMMGIIEFGLVLFADNVIENAASVGARFGITGSDYAGEGRVAKPTKGTVDRVTVIRENIRQKAGSLLDPARLSISCQSLGNTFGSLPASSAGDYACSGKVDNDKSCKDIGGGDAAVVYTVAYCWNFFTPIIGKFFPENHLLLESSMVVHNENFTSGSGSPGGN